MDISNFSPILGRLMISDLELLARRDALMLERHGGSAARVFEDQLEILFRSFGFGVVRARPGQERVDLLCIAPARQAFSFIVDAKSSKRPYQLPTDDRRAIEQYVRDIRASKLDSFAQLDFLLLVVGESAAMLDSRLAQLERIIHVPCRAIHAKELAHLRQQVAGPLDPEKFRDLCVGKERLIPRNRVDRLIAVTQKFETLQSSIADLAIRGLM